MNLHNYLLDRCNYMVINYIITPPPYYLGLNKNLQNKQNFSNAQDITENERIWLT